MNLGCIYNKLKLKYTLIGRGFEKPFDEFSIYDTIIDGKNMELRIGSHNHFDFASNSERERERDIEGEIWWVCLCVGF